MGGVVQKRSNPVPVNFRQPKPILISLTFAAECCVNTKTQGGAGHPRKCLGSTPPQVHTPSQINQMANIFNVPRYAGMMPVLPASYRPSAMLPSVGVTPLPAPSLPTIQQMEAPTAGLKEDSGRKMDLPAAVPRHAGHRMKLCPHKRQKSQCTDCGGSGICAHNRRRSQCTDCGGSGICTHKRQTSQCIDCGGSQVCPHKRQKSKCTDCGGSGICAHNRRRSQCTDCGGSEVCPHNRRKNTCTDCGGSSTCAHKRQKSQCIDCGGSQVCVKHKRLKRRCIFCPQAKDVCATHARVLCGWNGRKCRKCEEKAPATRWMHTVYDPRSGNPVRRFYEDEETAAAVARGEDPARVRARMLACRGRLLWKGRGW